MTPPTTLAEVLDRLHTLRRHTLDGWGPTGTAPTTAALRVAQTTAERLGRAGAAMPDVVVPDGDGGMTLRWLALEVGIGALGVLAVILDGEGESETVLRATPVELGVAVAERVAELLAPPTPRAA
jgi:hypothetical protein